MKHTFCSLGPADLTIGTVIPRDTNIVTANLFEQGRIEQKLIAVVLEPVTPELGMGDDLSFGGADPTKYTGDVGFLEVCAATRWLF
jgi:hypothetical protein